MADNQKKKNEKYSSKILIYIHTYVCMNVCMYVYTYVCVHHAHVCMYIRIYVYITYVHVTS